MIVNLVQHVLHKAHQLFYIGMKVFPASASATSTGLEFRAFKFDLQRIHKPVHQPPKSGDSR